MRRPLLLAGLVLAGLLLAASPGAAGKPIVVTFVGDSVAASIDYTPTAKAQLRRGLDVRLDLAVCRRLVQQSCTSNGKTPSSALRAVQSYGRSLGDVLVVEVGYNESAHGYADGIDRVVRAARKQGAKAVVWLTLREARKLYSRTNLAIRQAATRWPELRVADWDAYSRGRAWFRRDGLHLTGTGAEALAMFLRQRVLEAGRRTAAKG